MHVRRCRRQAAAARRSRQRKKLVQRDGGYAFGPHLLKVAKRSWQANGGTFAADELVATNVTDFSPYLLKIRNAKPDRCSTVAGAQINQLHEAYRNTDCRIHWRVRVRHRSGVGRAK